MEGIKVKKFILFILSIFTILLLVACGAEGKSRYDQMLDSKPVTSAEQVKELADISKNEYYRTATDAANAGISYNDYIRSMKQAEEDSKSGFGEIDETEAATPTPELTWKEKKYAGYDPNYDSGEDLDRECFFANNPARLETFLRENICYYETYYDYEDSTRTLEITKTKRNGKEYGVKAIYCDDAETMIYYYYLDEPDKIHCDYYCYDGLAASIDTDDGEYYMDMIGEEYDKEIKEINDEAIRREEEERQRLQVSKEELYEIAKSDAHKVISGKVYTDSIYSMFHYDDIDNVYFEQDGATCYINFIVTYHENVIKDLMGGAQNYFVQCVYVIQNDSLMLKSIDVE